MQGLAIKRVWKRAMNVCKAVGLGWMFGTCHILMTSKSIDVVEDEIKTAYKNRHISHWSRSITTTSLQPIATSTSQSVPSSSHKETLFSHRDPVFITTSPPLAPPTSPPQLLRNTSRRQPAQTRPPNPTYHPSIRRLPSTSPARKLIPVRH